MSKCYHTPIPDVVKQLLTCSDKLLFTATYDRDPPNFTYGTGNTGVANVSVVPNAISVIDTPFVLFQALPDEPTKFITEYYNLTSFSQDLEKQYGYISFTNTYPSEQQKTSIPAVAFPVAAKSGIFKCVDKVVIDYTNTIRVLYFFHKK